MTQDISGRFSAALERGIKRADEEDEKKREEQTDKLIRALSHVSPILDLPPEVVIQLLNGKLEVSRLARAIQAARDMEFTPEEMGQVLDLARVARIMEEDEPPMNVGVTGPTGPTGPIGVTGATGPTGPSSMRAHPKFRPMSVGPIKTACSPRR